MTGLKRKGPAACGSASRAVKKGQASSATVRKSKSLTPERQEFLNAVLKKIDDGTFCTAVYDGMRRVGHVVDRIECVVAFVMVGEEGRLLGAFPTMKEATHAVFLADKANAMGPSPTGTVQ